MVRLVFTIDLVWDKHLLNTVLMVVLTKPRILLGLAAGTYNVTVQDAKVAIQIVLLLRVNHQWSLIEQ
jgi:hypothetical protein